MFAPVRIFGWIYFNRVEQTNILPNEVEHVVSELAGSITYNQTPG